MIKKIPLLFFGLFGLICLLPQCKNPEIPKTQSADIVGLDNECIKRVFAVDDSIGKIRNQACSALSLEETIENYVRDIEAIDFAACPPAFTAAFRKHKEAWRDMQSVVSHHPDLRGEMHDLFDQIEVSKDSVIFKAKLKEIWDTWALVESSQN